MQWRWRTRVNAHNLLWTVLLGALPLVDLPQIDRDAHPEPTRLFNTFHSSDSFLQVTADTKDSSKRLVSLFESLPSSKTILVLVHYSDPASQLLGEVMAYLSWPHPVRILDVAGTNAASELAAIEPTSVAAFVFCGVNPPPWFSHGWRFGRSLEVVPVSREPKK
jgi:hypothetical protein